MNLIKKQGNENFIFFNLLERFEGISIKTKIETNFKA